MNLARMQAIAHDLAPCERSELPGGVVIPKLAGGSGAWIFTVREPQKLANKTAKRPANEEFTLTTANLLEPGIEPTMMEEWELTAINLSTSFTYELGVEAVANSVYIARLLIGGDVVWQQSQTLESQKFNKFLNQPRFTADFNTPLILPRGRQLQLSLSAIVGHETEEITVELVKGTISYYSRKLTGHRSL